MKPSSSTHMKRTSGDILVETDTDMDILEGSISGSGSGDKAEETTPDDTDATADDELDDVIVLTTRRPSGTTDLNILNVKVKPGGEEEEKEGGSAEGSADQDNEVEVNILMTQINSI